MYRRLDVPESFEQRHDFFQFRSPAVKCVFCLGLICYIAFLGQLNRRPSSPTEFLSSQSIGTQIVLSHGGFVLGTANADLGYSFRSIPYAHAGRWEEPRSVSWQGNVSSTRNQTSCLQPAYSSLTTPVEDCLKLNVFVPWAAEIDSELPVFVWLYGGGFIVGTAADSVPAEAAWHLVAAHRMIIVVPDTRLGAFGYLGSNRLRRNSTGNWGTLDQKLALSWVTQNIARFGGDPECDYNRRVVVRSCRQQCSARGAPELTDTSRSNYDERRLCILGSVQHEDRRRELRFLAGCCWMRR